MPRLTKDINNSTNIEEKKTAKKTKKTVKEVDAVKTTSNSRSKAISKTSKAKNSKVSKKSTSTSTKKNTKTTKVAKKSSPTKRTSRKKVLKDEIKTVFATEYYDLPYHYNETIVKLLAQTPNKLFVYWDISDEDRDSYIKQFGSDFFANTTPVLLVYNETKNYSFRVIINDFANSWYIPINDDNCKYRIELGRILNFVEPGKYINITTSNDLDAPNGHILLDELPSNIAFRNVKTKDISYKNISSISLLRKTKNLYASYQKLFGDIDFDILKNPSSGFYC